MMNNSRFWIICGKNANTCRFWNLPQVSN